LIIIVAIIKMKKVRRFKILKNITLRMSKRRKKIKKSFILDLKII
jgi:hypothetical protein